MQLLKTFQRAAVVFPTRNAPSKSISLVSSRMNSETTPRQTIRTSRLGAAVFMHNRGIDVQIPGHVDIGLQGKHAPHQSHERRGVLAHSLEIEIIRPTRTLKGLDNRILHAPRELVRCALLTPASLFALHLRMSTLEVSSAQSCC